MAEAERIRIDVAFEHGQAFSALVEEAIADDLERRLANGDESLVTIEAEDGRYAVAMRRVAYIKRYRRETRVGFGAGP